MHSPRVSVIMPTYNAEKYLKEAIDSILNQTFTDFEFLIIDDNSKDKTRDIVNSYKDERIRLIDGDCKGIAAALNKGISEAKGEYIARMDADDIALPNRFEVQIDVFKKHPDIGILGGKATFFGSNEFEGTDFNEGFFKNKPEYFEMGPINVLNTCVFCHPTVIFNKKYINKYSLRYNEDFRTSEDQELWSRAIRYVKMANINKVILKYRLHPQNASLVYKEGEKTALNAKIKLLNYLLPENTSKFKSLQEFEHLSYKINSTINNLNSDIYEENENNNEKNNMYNKKHIKFIQKIFSLTNEGNHKIIRFCFLTLKIKKKIKQKSHTIQNELYINQVFNKPFNSQYNLKKLDIAFIVPQPINGSGGHRNFYRAIKYLKDFGHNLTVYYTQTKEPADIVKQKVSDWFYDMGNIPFICYEGHLGYHDVGIATWWETAYNLKDNLDKIKYPFYFVQDFEPSFSPMSSNYILAENSYKLGFMHICSGPWCKEFLINKYNARAEYFQFPVDKKNYNTNKSRTKKNKNIIFFAKPEMARRCYEIGIKVLEKIKLARKDIEIILFGSNYLDKNSIPFDVTVKKLLPTIKDLADIYRNADLGIVFSTTNPSLVPYEMMACGCPVADIDFDFALSKYGENPDNVFLFDVLPENFAQKVLDIIDNKELLNKKAISGRDWVDKNFPSELEMAKTIEKIIISSIEENIHDKQ